MEKNYLKFNKLLGSLFPYELNEKNTGNYIEYSKKTGAFKNTLQFVDEEDWAKELFDFTRCVIVAKKIALIENITISKIEMENQIDEMLNRFGSRLEITDRKAYVIFALQNLLVQKVYEFFEKQGFFEDIASIQISEVEKYKSEKTFLEKELEA